MSSKRRSRQRGGQSSGRLLMIIAGVVVLVVAGAIAASVLLGGSGGGGTEIPASVPQYIDTEEGPLGAPALAMGERDAPVTIVEYSDFVCAACLTFSQQVIDDLIEDYIVTGQARMLYKPVAFIDNTGQYSPVAASAAYCAAEQGLFWNYHDRIWQIFATQGQTGYTLSNLASRASQVEGMDVAAWEACMNSDVPRQAVQTVEQEANARGVNSTPTVFVNGQQVQFTTASSFYADVQRAIEAQLD